MPVHDTVKQVTLDDGVGFIETLPRETLFLAQTPQGFRRDVLDAAIALGRAAPMRRTRRAWRSAPAIASRS